MKMTTTRIGSFVTAAALTALSWAAAADETEIFVGTGNAVTAQRPNILFVIDTSGSMSTAVLTQEPFDPAITYTGPCNAGRVYYASGSDANNTPSCSNNNSSGARRCIQV